MDDSIQRKKGAILSYVSIVISTIIQLLYTPLLIRMLGQSEYGLYSLIASIIGYLTVLDLGFGNAIIVYTSKYREQKKYEDEKKLHGMFNIIFMLIGLICVMLCIILYFNIEYIFGNTMTYVEIKKIKIMTLILSFNLFMTFAFNIYNSIISAYEKFAYQKIISIIGTVLKPIIMIPLLFLGYKSICMSIVMTVVNIIVLVSNYMFCKNKLNIKIKFMGFDKSIFKTILGYSIWLFLGSIVDKVNWSVDQTILGIFSGTTSVSIYSVAGNLNIMFISLSTALSGVFLPKISKMVVRNVSSDELTNEMIKVGRIQYIIIFLACSGLILFGKEFIVWWVGKEFVDSYYVALLLIIPVCFPLIQNVGLSIMQAKNKYKFRSISTFIMSIFNIIISIYFVSKYGAIGAALGTAIALIICNIIIINIYYYKELKLNMVKFWTEIIRMTIPFIIPVAVILLIMKLSNLSGIMSVIIYGTIYSVIYFFICYLLSMNKYEKELIINFLKKIGIN